MATTGTTGTTAVPEGELDPRFSSEGARARPWSEVEEVLSTAELFWLSTVRRDGRPHVVPLPAMWRDGALHFCTGAGEQKAKNLAARAECVLATGSGAFRSGLDVAVEGRAVRVTDEARLRALAAMWREKLDWPFEVVDGEFRDPAMPDGGGGGGGALVFAVRPVKVLAFGKGEPYSQTRYRFADA